MRRLGVLALFLAAGVAGAAAEPGRLAVLGDDGRVTVVADGKVQAVTPRHAGAALVAWAPEGDRLVVVEKPSPSAGSVARREGAELR